MLMSVSVPVLISISSESTSPLSFDIFAISALESSFFTVFAFKTDNHTAQSGK